MHFGFYVQWKKIIFFNIVLFHGFIVRVYTRVLILTAFSETMQNHTLDDRCTVTVHQCHGLAIGEQCFLWISINKQTKKKVRKCYIWRCRWCFLLKYLKKKKIFMEDKNLNCISLFIFNLLKCKNTFLVPCTIINV